MGYYSCCFFFFSEFPPRTTARLFPSLIGTSSVPGAHFFHTTGQPLRLKPFPSTFESIKNQFYWRNSIKKSRFFSLSLSRAQTQYIQLCSLSFSLYYREVSCFTRFSWKKISSLHSGGVSWPVVAQMTESVVVLLLLLLLLAVVVAWGGNCCWFWVNLLRSSLLGHRRHSLHSLYPQTNFIQTL